MKIACAYIRVSTDDQTELSPDSQIKQIREYAKKHDMLIPDELIFSDEGISGKTSKKRPAFNRMIGLAKTNPKPFDVILVWKYSRFARNREDSIVYKSMLRKQLDIDVISISENFGDSKMAVLFEAQIEAMDEYYSINLAEEVTRGMSEKVSRGGCVSGPALGYDVVNKSYVVNTLTAPIVKRIYNDFVGGMGSREIAVKLNEEGIKTSRGGKWENRTVEYILRNTLYVGKVHWSPSGRVRRNYEKEVITVDGVHEPIIDIETFRKVQERIAERKRPGRKNEHPTPQEDWMLRGLLKCSNCGATLTKSIKGHVQCHMYAKGKCEISHSASIQSLNALVLDLIEMSLTTGNINITKLADIKQTDETNTLLQMEYKKLERVKQAYENGVDTLDEYRTNKAKIAESINRLKAKAPKKTDETAFKKQFCKKHLQTLKMLKSNITETEKNRLIKGFVEKIIYTRATNSVGIIYYA